MFCKLNLKVEYLVNCNSLFAIFNQTLMNMFSNYLPNKLIKIDDKDPPWMNDYIKRKIMDKLNDSEKSAKTYWSILKTLFNRQKITLIPPI